MALPTGIANHGPIARNRRGRSLVRHPRNHRGPPASRARHLLAGQVLPDCYGALVMQIARVHAYHLTLTGRAHVVGTLGPFHLLSTGDYFK